MPYTISTYAKWFVGGLISLTLLTIALLLFIPPSGIPAHWVCWQRAPALIPVHLIGDLLVWSAYTAIPLLALYIMIKGKIDYSSPICFPSLLVWGALFIWSCGQTHLLDAVEIWYQIQWRRGVMKLITGVVSWIFVIALVQQRQRLMTVAKAVYRALEEDKAEEQLSTGEMNIQEIIGRGDIQQK